MRRSWLANQTSKQTKNPAPRAGKHWFECVYMYPSTAVLFVLFAALRYLKLIVAPSSVSSVMGGSCGCVDSRNALDEGSSTRIAVLGTPAKGEFKWLIDRSIDRSIARSLAPSLTVFQHRKRKVRRDAQGRVLKRQVEFVVKDRGDAIVDDVDWWRRRGSQDGEKGKVAGERQLERARFLDKGKTAKTAKTTTMMIRKTATTIIATPLSSPESSPRLGSWQ